MTNIMQEAPKGFDSNAEYSASLGFKYTIDHHDIFCVPPNSNVLHAANEEDFNKPDVFGLGYSRSQFCSCESDKTKAKGEAEVKPSISVDQAIERCDSASSQMMLQLKTDEDKTVSSIHEKPAGSFSFRKLLGKCFNKK